MAVRGTRLLMRYLTSGDPEECKLLYNEIYLNDMT